MNQEQVAFSAEIAKMIKEWSDRSDKLGLNYVASISLEDPKGEKKGIQFQQAISAPPSTIVQGALATIQEIPIAYKLKQIHAFLRVLAEENEDAEIRFNQMETEDQKS